MKLRRRCPVCGRRCDVVVYSTSYLIWGCPEHRDYDQVIWRDEIQGDER